MSARLYLETPAGAAPEAVAPLLGAVLGTGAVACVRLALAGADEAAWRHAVAVLGPLARAHDVALLVTDHYRLVRPLDLDGVHLADGRTPLREVRRALGPDRIVGGFAGASRHRGMTLAEAGADYVSLGPVRPAGALGPGEQADDALFEWWAEVIETPVVAEGGVTPDDARRLADWADFALPDPALWRAPDPAAAVRAYAEAMAG